jgi:periplasmic protein CpxP/Spy
MEHTTKNKLLTWLVVLLLIANAASITMFWIGKEKALPVQQEQQQQRERPAEFLIRELRLDTKQQEQLEVLRAAHTDAAVVLRKELGKAKKIFFALIKQPGITDSMKLAAAKPVSDITEKLDLLALNHFIKVRAICNAEQQQKFDKIIEQVTEMISKAGEAPPRDENRPPPDNDRKGKRPPPPDDRDDNKPPPQN